jgi:1-aminocyclopropane-1-carboxylate deaminase
LYQIALTHEQNMPNHSNSAFCNALYNAIRPTPLTELHHRHFAQRGVRVWIKRDDLNHPDISGNKWHKLYYNILAAQNAQKTALLTFGGAYSNHIAATAAAAKANGLHSIGIIRGDELQNNAKDWGATLNLAQHNGMQLQFISRADYRLKDQAPFLAQLQRQYPNAYIVPEGGSNDLAVQGFAPLIHDLENQCPSWTHLLTAVGTGGTLAGMVSYALPKVGRHILGVAVLKQADYLRPQITQWITQNSPHAQVNPWQLLGDYHGGGYAKTAPNITAAQSQFEHDFNIPLDPIYTAKLVAGFYDLLTQNAFKAGDNIILLHTGGLQGRLTKE